MARSFGVIHTLKITITSDNSQTIASSHSHLATTQHYHMKWLKLACPQSPHYCIDWSKGYLFPLSSKFISPLLEVVLVEAMIQVDNWFPSRVEDSVSLFTWPSLDFVGPSRLESRQLYSKAPKRVGSRTHTHCRDAGMCVRIAYVAMPCVGYIFCSRQK